MKSLVKTFLSEQCGSVSVEYVIWLPFMFAFMMLTSDVSIVFLRQQLLYDAARDATRQVALGQKSTTDARTDLLSRFDAENADYDSAVTVNNGYVTARVWVPYRDVTIFADSLLGEGTLSAEVSMWIETNS